MNLKRTWTGLICAALMVGLLPGMSAAVGPSGSGIVFADADTLVFKGSELRGLTWLAPDTCVVLLAHPDTLPELPPLDVSLYWFSAAGDTLRVEDFTGTLDRGLVFDGKYFWSLGDVKADIPAMLYKIEADTLFVEGTYPTPGHRPVDLAFDGSDIWMVDQDRGRLDKFSVENEEITRSYPTPGFSPSGVAFDGSFFWITDRGTGRAYRLSRSGRSWNGTVQIESFYARGRDVQLVWDGEFLWRFAVSDSVAYGFTPR